MTSHPDVEALAFFAEDLLDPDEERSVAAHIETCANCATTIDELAGVTHALAEAPAPALPSGIADLLDDRIAEAVRERSGEAVSASETPAEPADGIKDPATDPAKDPDEVPATVTPITAARSRRFGLPKLMMVAAATVFVVGGGAALFNGLMVQPQEEGAASPLIQEDSEPESAPDTAQTYSADAVRSGTVYTDDQLGAQASTVLSETEGSEEDGDIGTQSQEQVSDETQGCVTRFEEAGDARVTLVDDALFDSGDGAERALVFFTQDTDGAGVVVIDPSCTEGGDIDGSILAEDTL